MNNQILKLILALSFACILTACVKEEDKDQIAPAAASCAIKYLKDTDTGDSTVFSYDSQNRIEKLEQYDQYNTLVNVATYTYGTNKITYDFVDADGSTTAYFYLNVNGTIDHLTAYREFLSGTYKIHDTIFYTYNAEGYNDRQVEKQTVENTTESTIETIYDTTWNTYMNGNLVISKLKQHDGTVVITTNEYYALIDKQSFDVDFLIPGFLGKGNKNLIKSSSNDSDSDTELSTYEMNSDGYVTRYTTVYSNETNSDQVDTRISYTCK